MRTSTKSSFGVNVCDLEKSYMLYLIEDLHRHSDEDR